MVQTCHGLAGPGIGLFCPEGGQGSLAAVTLKALSGCGGLGRELIRIPALPMLLRGPHWAWHSFGGQDADHNIVLTSVPQVSLTSSRAAAHSRERKVRGPRTSFCLLSRKLPQRVDAFACCAAGRVFLRVAGLKTR